ncbi:hypothetical protein [Aureispira anguillae]|uniref:Uncharacterized protein n=1 Tax=Aureispira anguillae TaxID=2864201 RepID=A0A915YAV2_9BACT|nr:hypothetical protein [Aureispira anguillae]BDS09736.1 hypothetical protein AsAng_0004410 [Aureispira anguillae]
MKYLIIVVLIGALSINLQAQDCLYEIDQVDPFNEEVEQLTEAVVIAKKVKREGALPLRKVMAQWRRIGAQQYLVLKFPVTMIMSPTFTDKSSDSELILLLENKQKVILPLADLMRNVEDKVEFRYATDFVLMEEDIVLLQKYPITAIRVGMKNNTFDVHLEQGAAETLMETLECIK